MEHCILTEIENVCVCVCIPYLVGCVVLDGYLVWSELKCGWSHHGEDHVKGPRPLQNYGLKGTIYHSFLQKG